jgi:Raf kinase inhibitor-like YbhB/YbcL family protein
MQLISPAFAANQMMAKKFSCQGADINPPLEIRNIPAVTQSLALIMDDLDSLTGNWVQWIAYDIPLTDRIEENSNPGKQGINDFGDEQYSGPCPGYEPHRYLFKLYALDTVLHLKKGADKEMLLSALQGHILDKAELIGIYEREI